MWSLPSVHGVCCTTSKSMEFGYESNELSFAPVFNALPVHELVEGTMSVIVMYESQLTFYTIVMNTVVPVPFYVTLWMIRQLGGSSTQITRCRNNCIWQLLSLKVLLGVVPRSLEIDFRRGLRVRWRLYSPWCCNAHCLEYSMIDVAASSSSTGLTHSYVLSVLQLSRKLYTRMG